MKILLALPSTDCLRGPSARGRPKLHTRNPKPETRNPKPETLNGLEPGAVVGGRTVGGEGAQDEKVSRIGETTTTMTRRRRRRRRRRVY